MNAPKISYDDRVKPKHVLALNEKVAAIRRYEADPVYKSVGRYFRCSPDQIKRIIQQKHAILAEWSNRTRKSVFPTSHELKSVKMSFLGKAVHEWIRRMMYYTDFNLTDALIQTMAVEFKKVLGLYNFFPDKSWVAHFRSTYNLKDVNTKDLDIGYQESHSVQIRDILRHLQEACGASNSVTMEAVVEGVPSNDGASNVQDDFCRIKVEGGADDVEMKNTCYPSCSTSMQSSESEKQPTVRLLSPQTIAAIMVAVKQDPASLKLQISTHDEALNCVKMLEEFALLKENFRLIGLIERLEEALKEKQ